MSYQQPYQGQYGNSRGAGYSSRQTGYNSGSRQSAYNSSSRQGGYNSSSRQGGYNSGQGPYDSRNPGGGSSRTLVPSHEEQVAAQQAQWEQELPQSSRRQEAQAQQQQQQMPQSSRRPDTRTPRELRHPATQSQYFQRMEEEAMLNRPPYSRGGYAYNDDVRRLGGDRAYPHFPQGQPPSRAYKCKNGCGRSYTGVDGRERVREHEENTCSARRGYSLNNPYFNEFRAYNYDNSLD